MAPYSLEQPQPKPAILDRYPLEILRRIFLNLSPGDVANLLNDYSLRELVLERRYSVIYVDTEKLSTNRIVPFKDCTSVPARLLPALYVKSNIEKKVLQFEDLSGFISFSSWKPNLVRGFYKIEQIGRSLTLDEVQKIPELPNLTELGIASKETIHNSTVSLPENLETLRATKIIFENYPTNLLRLHLLDVGNVEHISLPRGLKELIVKSNHILQTFIEKLPQTIAILQLHDTGVSHSINLDLSKYESLKSFRIQGIALSSEEYPNSLTSIEYVSYRMRDANVLLKLPKLTAFKLDLCTLIPKFLTCKLPRTLTEVHIERAKMEFVEDEYVKTWNAPYVFDIKVPPHLRSLVFHQKEKSSFVVHNNVASHKTLKILDLKVSGFYYDFDPEEPEPDFTSLENIAFSPSLERMILKGVAFQDVPNLSIEECEIETAQLSDS